jgi:transcriptional regulator with XRE-family HTH domain
MSERESNPEPDAAQLSALGARVEAQRRDAGKSAREVALEAGISPVYLRVIETGRNAKTGRASRPSAEILVRLAQALEMEPDDLLEDAGYMDLRAELKGEAAAVSEDRRELSAEVAAIAEAIDLARTRPSDFLRELFAAELSRFETQLSALASGSFTCSPVDEPRIRRLALLDACHRSLHAVSFDDDAWWLGPEGKSHMALHAEVGARETAPVMTRIFLLAPRDRERYDTVLTAHAQAGVEVLIANPLDVPDLGRRDLEIYDRALLREATSSGGSDGGRYAEFTDDHARLKRAENAYASIRHVASPLSGA